MVPSKQHRRRQESKTKGGTNHPFSKGDEPPCNADLTREDRSGHKTRARERTRVTLERGKTRRFRNKKKKGKKLPSMPKKFRRGESFGEDSISKVQGEGASKLMHRD